MKTFFPKTTESAILFFTKTYAFISLIVLIIFSFGILSFALVKPQEKKLNGAVVSQVQGIYIFTDCKPTCEYTSLGKEKVGFVASPQYTNVRDKLIKKVREKFPTANGIIFDGDDKAEAIILK